MPRKPLRQRRSVRSPKPRPLRAHPRRPASLCRWKTFWALRCRRKRNARACRGCSQCRAGPVSAHASQTHRGPSQCTWTTLCAAGRPLRLRRLPQPQAAHTCRHRHHRRLRRPAQRPVCRHSSRSRAGRGCPRRRGAAAAAQPAVPTAGAAARAIDTEQGGGGGGRYASPPRCRAGRRRRRAATIATGIGTDGQDHRCTEAHRRHCRRRPIGGE